MDYFGKEVKMIEVEFEEVDIFVTNVFLDEIPYLKSMTRFQEKVEINFRKIFQETYLPSSGFLQEEADLKFFAKSFGNFYKIVHGLSYQEDLTFVMIDFLLFLLQFFNVDPRLIKEHVVSDLHYDFFIPFFRRTFMKGEGKYHDLQQEFLILTSLDVLVGMIVDISEGKILERIS